MIRLIFIIFSLLLSSVLFSQNLLTVEESIAIALKNNYTISIAKNDLTISQLSNNFGNAGFLPTVDLTATQSVSINNSKQEFRDGSVVERSDAKTTTLTSGIQLQWTIFDGFSMFAERDRLRSLEELGSISYRSAIESSLSQVIITYYAIVRQNNLLSALRETIATSVKRKRITEEKLRLGSGSRLQVLQAMVDLNADSSRLMAQEQSILNLKADLNRLLAREVTTTFQVSTDLKVKNGYLYDVLKTEAFKQNPQLNAARVQMLLTELSVSRAKSTLYPRLRLNAGYNFNETEAQVGQVLYNQGFGPTVGITASFNLFDGFKSLTALEVSDVLVESSRFAVEQTQQTLEGELFKAWSDYQFNLKLISFEVQNLAAAKENTKIALERYELGILTDLELRDTQQRQLEAESRLLGAQFAAKQAEISLLRLTGLLHQTMN